MVQITLAQIIALALKKVCPKMFHCIEYIFHHSGFLNNFPLALKNRVCHENFHCIECSFTFRIFEQLALDLQNRVSFEFTVLNIYFLSFGSFEKLALPWKQSLPWNFSLYWNIFYHSGFLSNLRLPWKTQCALNSLYWIYIFYHSRILNNLRLPLKQSLPLNFSPYWNIFHYSGFLARCACSENRVCPEVFQAVGMPPPTPASYAYGWIPVRVHHSIQELPGNSNGERVLWFRKSCWTQIAAPSLIAV